LKKLGKFIFQLQFSGSLFICICFHSNS